MNPHATLYEEILGKECNATGNYLSNYSADDFFIHDNYKRAEWIRKVEEGSNIITQKITFTFDLDWNNNKIICKNIIDITNHSSQ